MPVERPLLTARWTELVILSFALPPEVVARLAPRGTVPDLFNGQAYASVIGFMFRDARLLGLRFPGHSRFEEVNLRFYVGREADGRLRRGVVFVREIAPRPLVAAVARCVYNESYVTRPMRSRIEHRNDELRSFDTRDSANRHTLLGAGSRVDYAWRTGGRRQRRWNRIAARADADAQLPTPGSLEEFIVEHYWAYVRGRDDATWEYRVAHRPWHVAPATDVVWDCDVAATYGHSPLAPYLCQPPASAFIADGSPVQVFHGHRLEADATTPQPTTRIATPSPRTTVRPRVTAGGIRPPT